MTFDVGSRVRIIDEDRYGQVIGHSADQSNRGDFIVRLEDAPWDEGFFDFELEEVPQVGETPAIMRYLAFNGSGGLEWLNYLEFSSKYDRALAFGWSDGIMTWTERRD